MPDGSGLAGDSGVAGSADFAGFAVARAGAILAVSDFAASLRFYRDQLGLTEVALYDDPPYVTLSVAGARISLAEQGHPAPDRPGVGMAMGRVSFLLCGPGRLPGRDRAARLIRGQNPS